MIFQKWLQMINKFHISQNTYTSPFNGSMQQLNNVLSHDTRTLESF